MTNLEAIEKIRKLPKLKKGYVYEVSDLGQVLIWTKKPSKFSMQVYYSFSRVVENKYTYELEKYIDYFAKPISFTEEKVIRTIETKIVGYE